MMSWEPMLICSLNPLMPMMRQPSMSSPPGSRTIFMRGPYLLATAQPVSIKQFSLGYKQVILEGMKRSNLLHPGQSLQELHNFQFKKPQPHLSWWSTKPHGDTESSKAKASSSTMPVVTSHFMSTQATPVSDSSLWPWSDAWTSLHPCSCFHLHPPVIWGEATEIVTPRLQPAKIQLPCPCQHYHTSFLPLNTKATSRRDWPGIQKAKSSETRPASRRHCTILPVSPPLCLWPLSLTTLHTAIPAGCMGFSIKYPDYSF